MSIPQYPMVYLLADGRLLQSGTTETSDGHAHAQHRHADLDHDRFAAARWRQRRDVRAGQDHEVRQFVEQRRYAERGFDVATTYVLNMNDASPAWRQTQSMAYPRTFHNLTSLADGSVLVTSGSRKKSETNLNVGVLQAELWSPDTETWTTMASAQKSRASITRPQCCCRMRASPYPGPATLPAPPTRPTSRSIRRRTCSRARVRRSRRRRRCVKYGNSFFVQTPDGANIKAVNLDPPGRRDA